MHADAYTFINQLTGNSGNLAITILVLHMFAHLNVGLRNVII